ncbi:MAG: hypothetical protein R2942_19920 [Ignavibacteria bacterium]
MNFDVGESNRGVIHGVLRTMELQGTTNGGQSWSYTKGGDGGELLSILTVVVICLYYFRCI